MKKKTISYECFLDLISKASFIMADDIEVKAFSISKKPNIEAVYLRGETNEDIYSIDIDRELNEIIEVEGSSAFPIDNEGDPIQITFYEPMIIRN